MMLVYCTLLMLVLSLVAAFVPPSPSPSPSPWSSSSTKHITSHSTTRSLLLATDNDNQKKNRDKAFVASLKEVGKEDMPVFFTGGFAFDKTTESSRDASIKIASRIRSVKDLGWTQPSKRRGAARPRHRAYGGQTEKPIQLKPNYDESSPKCVEKWLTQETFYDKVNDSSPAADAVFCALAGGAAFAEREIVESRLGAWRGPDLKQFDETAFLKSVEKGRTDLARGYVLFFAANALLVLCIAVPTNPVTKALEAVIDQIRDTWSAL